MNDVAQSQFVWIDTELVGKVIYDGLRCEDGLHEAGTAEIAAGDGVCIDLVGDDADVVDAVRLHHGRTQEAAIGRNGGVCGIGAGGEVALRVPCGDRAVTARADAHSHDGGVAGVHGGELFRVVHDPLDGVAGLLGKQVADDDAGWVHLAAE